MGRGQRWAIGIAVAVTFAGAVSGCSDSPNGTEVGVGMSTQGGITTQGTTNFAGLTLAGVETIAFRGGATTLEAPGAGEEYLLVVGSADLDADDYTVRLDDGGNASALLASPTALLLEAESPESQFHQFLREMEPILAATEQPVRQSTHFAAARLPAQLPEVGAVQSYRVLSSLSSITQYREVSARIRMVTDGILLAVETSAEDHVSDEDLRNLVADFEEIAMPRIHELFGVGLDINTDGHLTILMSCGPNAMVTTGGLMTGFFSPNDRYARSASNPASNGQEILYTMVPDPDGSCGGTPVSESFTFSILPGVLAHEYQHLINFDHHVFLYGGTTEEPWLNECLSHIAEDLTGFGNENPSRVRLFLAQPRTTAVVPPTSPTLAERGACYAFLRYLYEQADEPEGFLWSLSNTSRRGVENVEVSFASDNPDFDEMSEFLNRWSVAVALSESGLTDDPRYNYQPRVENAETGQYEGLCLRCTALDGRGTILTGPVVETVTDLPTSASSPVTANQFYEIEDANETITVSETGGGEIFGTLIRLQRF